MREFEFESDRFKFRTESCRIAARLRGLKRYSTGVSRSIMPSRNDVDGVSNNTRSKSTPSKTPPRKAASPKSSASRLSSKRKKKRTPPGTKSGRKKVEKRLDKSFNQNDVGPDDQEPDESETAAPGGGTPDVRPERVPEPYPPSVVDQLEASNDPLMKLVAQQFRALQAREDSLRNELASVKAEADARQS